MDLSFGLHDAEVVSIDENEEYTLIHFNTTWSCQLLMEFYNVVESNLETETYYSDSSIMFEAGKIVFLTDFTMDLKEILNNNS